MSRPKSPDGRRVAMSARFSESESAEIDAARGGVERSPWLRAAALAAARGVLAVRTVPVNRNPESRVPVNRNAEPVNRYAREPWADPDGFTSEPFIEDP